MPKGRGKGRKRKGPARIVTPARSVPSEDQPGTSTAGLIPASDDPDTLKMSEPSQTSRPSTQQQQQQQKNIRRHHTQMIIKLGGMFSPEQWHSICNQVEMMEYVSTRDMGDVKSMADLCKALMRNGVIEHGEYSNLREILVTCNVKAGVTIDDYTKRIHQEREVTGPSPAKQPRPGDPVQSTEIHWDLKPMIETAKATIKREKEKKFYPTKGFCDAKEKLQKNRVVVIRGNTGDGKTAIAVQLLHWLSQEHEAGQPLQIHKIKKLELLAPNLKLFTFIDDIFGEKDVCKKDVQEWNRRISAVETLFVDEQAQPNFLIITIRNEVFNSLEKRSLRTILTEDNIIDLSSHTYKLAEEKKELLELYKPKNFSWTDEEKTQISTYAPNIGFPQCCKLFYNSKELQKERVNFFENPFHFLNKALLRLQECSALLYLFLNGGKIRVQDLDPNRENVNKILLEQAFSIKLIGGKNHTATPLCNKIEKVGFIKDSLDELLDFLVKKEKHWSGEDVYRFNHDSIYVAVALLYGKVTPIGYIQNCPRKSLSYLTTSETATNMIVISSVHYTAMCERLLGEFEYKKNHYDTSIGSLHVWNDPVFVKSFVRLLDDRKVDKLDVLNKACYCDAKKCVLYLLSEGVKPDKETALLLVTIRHWKDRNKVSLLREIVVYLNDETKVDVLNKACCSGAEEAALYLLSEGVKPDKDTALRSLIDRHWNDSNKVCLLRKIVVYLNAEAKLDVLNEACSSGAEECVLYLLSEGVKPDKDTALSLVSNRHWNDSKRQVCLLRKIVVYLNAEAKLDVLNKACSSGAEECALYLLSEGVKPDKNTALSLVNGYCNDSTKVCLLRKSVVYLNDKAKLAVLNKACVFGAEECVLYLLSEGVKPDMDTRLWILIYKHRNDSTRQVCLLGKVVVYLNDETKVAMLNKLCYIGEEECALYLLCEGVEPDKVTPFNVVEEGSVKLLRKLLQYNVTPTARNQYNHNVLHWACLYRTEEVVTLLCDTYPHLVHDTGRSGQTPLHVVVQSRNCSMSQTVERFVLNSLYRVDDQQHKCESVNGRVIHRNCVCAQYMAQLVDVEEGSTVLHWNGKNRSGNREVCLYLCQSYPALTTAVDNEGRTALHASCRHGNREVCLCLCRSYPALTTAVDNDGWHCLHYLAWCTSDVDLFTECESHVKQYLESTGRKYDITTIRDNDGETVLHKSCKRGGTQLCLYLCRSYPALTTAVDKYGCHCLHHLAKSVKLSVDLFTECEYHVKQYLESTGRKYDITTILDNKGESVLDKAKERTKGRAKIWGEKNNPLLDHLIKVFGK